MCVSKDQLQTDRVLFRTSDAALNTCASGGNAQLLYEVYDVMGRKLTSTIVGQVNAGAHRVTTDMASYAAGLYMIRVLNGQQEAVTELFLKE